MQRLIMVVAALALGACVTTKPKVERGPDLAKNLRPDCYTVDLFDPYRLHYPQAGVPAEHFDFLGVWKQGAWNGEWCHDLYVTKINPDGTAEVLDAYGPYAKNGIEATVFKRSAKIEGNELIVSGGTGIARYRLAGDFLLGQRRDIFGKYEITMARTDRVARVPLPPPNPRRLASR